MGNLQSFEREGSLTKAELDRLERRLRKLGRGRSEVARSDLKALNGLGQNNFVERIFQMFDEDKDGFLMLPNLENMMEVFLKLRDEEMRCQFAFAIFDQNGDGYIDEAELLIALQMTNKRGMTDEQLRQIVGALIQKWDRSGDGRLTYPEFRELLTASVATLTL